MNNDNDHPSAFYEVMRDNESHWSGLSTDIDTCTM